MHIVLGNEIADVDLAEFEKVGSFHDGVVAVPLVDVCLGMKGMSTSAFDEVDECQNSIILTYEAPEDEEQLEVELSEDPFTPGIIYRCRRTALDYVELMYKSYVGALKIYTYFLVKVENCSFACRGKDLDITPVNYAELWNMGLIRDLLER